MTVKELIAQLVQHDPSAEICVAINNTYEDIDEVLVAVGGTIILQGGLGR